MDVWCQVVGMRLFRERLADGYKMWCVKSHNSRICCIFYIIKIVMYTDRPVLILLDRENSRKMAMGSLKRPDSVI